LAPGLQGPRDLGEERVDGSEVPGGLVAAEAVAGTGHHEVRTRSYADQVVCTAQAANPTNGQGHSNYSPGSRRYRHPAEGPASARPTYQDPRRTAARCASRTYVILPDSLTARTVLSSTKRISHPWRTEATSRPLGPRVRETSLPVRTTLLRRDGRARVTPGSSYGHRGL